MTNIFGCNMLDHEKKSFNLLDTYLQGHLQFVWDGAMSPTCLKCLTHLDFRLTDVTNVHIPPPCSPTAIYLQHNCKKRHLIPRPN